MANKVSHKVYNSFEQFKSQLFPDFTEKELRKKTRENSEGFGACLADKAVDNLLKNKRKSVKSRAS